MNLLKKYFLLIYVAASLRLQSLLCIKIQLFLSFEVKLLRYTVKTLYPNITFDCDRNSSKLCFPNTSWFSSTFGATPNCLGWWVPLNSINFKNLTLTLYHIYWMLINSYRIKITNKFNIFIILTIKNEPAFCVLSAAHLLKVASTQRGASRSKLPLGN